MHRILAVILMIVMLMPAAQAEVLLGIHAFTCTPTENGATLTWEKEGTGELYHWQVYAYYTEPCFEVILDENIGKATTYDVIWDNDRSKVVCLSGYLVGETGSSSGLQYQILSDNILSDEFLAMPGATSPNCQAFPKPEVEASVTDTTLTLNWPAVEGTNKYRWFLRDMSFDQLLGKGIFEKNSHTFDHLNPGTEYRVALIAVHGWECDLGLIYGDHWYTNTLTTDAIPQDADPYVSDFFMSHNSASIGEEVEFNLFLNNASEGDMLTVMFCADDWTETFDLIYPEATFKRAFSQAGLRNIQFKVTAVNGEAVEGKSYAMQALNILPAEGEATPITPEVLPVESAAPTAGPEVLPVEPAAPTAEPTEGILNINESALIDANGRMDIPSKNKLIQPHYYLDAGTVAQDPEILEKIIFQFDVMQNYQPDENGTYCNIFASNVARAMGAFLPGGEGSTVCRNCYGIVGISNDYTGWKDIISERNLYCTCGNRHTIGIAFNTKKRYSWDEVGKELTVRNDYTADLTKWFIEKSADFGWEVINDYTADNYPNITDFTPELKSETIQQAISYANQGYLVVAVRSDWIPKDRNHPDEGISGHAFIVHPNADTNTLYTTQAGGGGANRENKPDGNGTRSSNNGWNVYYVFKGID